jgi:molecular chaperone GrpE
MKSSAERTEEQVSKKKTGDELHEEDVSVEENLTSSEREGGAVEDQTPQPAEERDVEKELADALVEAANLRDKMLRAAAENENFKKRIERERSASLKYAGEQIFREMLPAVDNLERAIAHQGETVADSAEKSLGALVEGVELTLKSLITTLEKFQVKPLESVGEKFDPKHHEALTMEASDTVPETHVVNQFEKGYYYKDRLLRAAKVTVSSGKKDTGSGE